MASFFRPHTWGKLTIQTRSNATLQNSFVFPLIGSQIYQFGDDGDKIILPDYRRLKFQMTVDDRKVSLLNTDDGCSLDPSSKKESKWKEFHSLDAGDKVVVEDMPAEYYIKDCILRLCPIMSPGASLLDDCFYQQCSKKCQKSLNCKHKVFKEIQSANKRERHSMLKTKEVGKDKANTSKNGMIRAWIAAANQSDQSSSQGSISDGFDFWGKRKPVAADLNVNSPVCCRCFNCRWPLPINQYYTVCKTDPSGDQQKEEIACLLCVVALDKSKFTIKPLDITWIFEFNNNCVNRILEMKNTYEDMADWNQLSDAAGKKIQCILRGIDSLIRAVIISRKSMYSVSYNRAIELQEPALPEIEKDRQEFLKKFSEEINDRRQYIASIKNSLFSLDAFLNTCSVP